MNILAASSPGMPDLARTQLRQIPPIGSGATTDGRQARCSYPILRAAAHVVTRQRRKRERAVRKRGRLRDERASWLSTRPRRPKDAAWTKQFVAGGVVRDIACQPRGREENAWIRPAPLREGGRNDRRWLLFGRRRPSRALRSAARRARMSGNRLRRRGQVARRAIVGHAVRSVAADHHVVATARPGRRRDQAAADAHAQSAEGKPPVESWAKACHTSRAARRR